MRSIAIASCLLSLCAVARADTFVIDYQGRAQVDPVVSFEADCLGASEAPDCATRASLLEAELVEGLAELEGLSDEATQALFTGAVGSDSAAVKEVGLRYFSRRRELPSTLWTSVKQFFLGPDPQVGQPSAEIMGFSGDSADQALSELYLTLRPSSLYDSNLPQNAGEQDEWAQACASDARLDEVPAFAEGEQFAPASRLLAVDRYLNDIQTGTPSIPASGFVTDAPRTDVVAFFDKLFGTKAYPPLGSSEARLTALNAELAALQPRLASGDQDAIKRVTSLLDEVSKLSEGITVASALALDADACADCVYWVAGPAADVFSKPFTRGVIVGTQAELQRTMISYLGSGGTLPSVPTDGGSPTQGSDAGVQPGSDAGDEPPAPTKKSSGGCATRGDVTGGWWLLALGLWLARRRQGQFM